MIPIRNEAEVLPELCPRLASVLEGLGLSWEVLLVNDGSTDGSLDVMKRFHARDRRLKIVDLSRGFGQQAAISAGLELARGRAVVVMDGDLQDPPEVVPALVARWREGWEVVYAIRRHRPEPWPKRVAYSGFYRVLNLLSDIPMPRDSGDFALVDRRVVEQVVRLPERTRYLRGLRAWLGFRQIGVEYRREPRAGGASKYDGRRLLRLAGDGIFAFSDAPLRLVRNLGLLLTVTATVLGVGVGTAHLVRPHALPGLVLLAVLVFFFGGLQVLVLGILGEYLARIYGEVRSRPRYVIRECHGIEPAAVEHRPPAVVAR